MKKEIKKFLFNHGTDLLVGFISLIILLIGLKVVGLVSIFVVILLDSIWFLLPVIKKGKKEEKSDVMKRKKKIETNPPKKKKKKIWKIIKIILLLFLLLFIAASIAGGIFIYKIVKAAPNFDPKRLYQNESTIIRYPNGEIWTKLGTQKREIITYDEMSESLINAIVATEDSRFFQHNGFDLPRFAVASFKQVLGKDAGGASTLTMQLSKNFYTSKKSEGVEGIKRKFTDIYMSIFQIEKKYTKKEIMEFYANSNYLGGGSYGVEQASLTYFGKHASELNIAESALIAGLFQSPDAYDPLKHPEAAEKRRNTVLYLMERHGYITSEERAEAKKATTNTLIKKSEEDDGNIKYKAFLDTVIDEIINDTKSEANDWKGNNPYVVPMDITTTIDTGKQEFMDNIMNGTSFEWENENVTAGVSIIDNETGALIAVGAGRNRVGTDFNTATETKKQIGSTAKPLYDYGPGIEYENWSTYTPFIDEPYTYTGGTQITNWDGGYYGFQTMRQALVGSRNIPALKAFQSNKNSNIRNFVKSLGLHPEGEGSIHEAHSIGGYTGESPLSMAGAYAAFARGGYYIEPYSYTKIIYRNTNEVIENKKVKNKVMSDATAYMITDMLIETGQSALSSRYNNVNGKQFAAKTGTTNFASEFKQAHNLPAKAINDLWVVGYNKDYTIGLWYGYLDWKKGYTIHGNFNHARLFQTVARGFFTSDATYQKPDSVTEVRVEYGTNPAALPSEYTPEDKIVTELFKVGTEPTKISTAYLKLNDPTGLTYKVNGTKVTLTWNKVSSPSSLDTSSYGNLGYNVYKQVGDELKLLKFVTETTYTDTVTDTEEKATYVVRTKFSNEENFMSDGTTINVTIKDEISISFADKSSETTLYVGDTYIDPNFVVTVNGKEVFKGNKSNDDVKIEKTSTTVVDTKKATTTPIVIQYKVTYKDVEKSFARKVIVKEKEKDQQSPEPTP